MARESRLIVPHLPHHIFQMGNDRRTVFQDHEDYRSFLFWLLEASRQFKVAVHAYVLMPDSWQLLVTPTDEQGLARMLQWVGRYYVPYFNKKYDRSGTLWQGRFKASVIEPEAYFMRCCRHIEMIPVRAGMAAHPSDYPWSSYAPHVGDRQDALISGHALYWALGNTPFDRELAYKKKMMMGVSSAESTALDLAIRKGRPLGSEGFQIELEKQLNRKVRAGKRGRPRQHAK